MTTDELLGSSTLAIVQFCAIECGLQMSGERSVHWMLTGWAYALQAIGVQTYGTPARATGRAPMITDVKALGRAIEPFKNGRGFRKVDVRVGASIKMPWLHVEEAMRNHVAYASTSGREDPAEWFRQYEEIHPFRDGNGRTGAILFNWLNDTLEEPIWPPNYWHDPRRIRGEGA